MQQANSPGFERWAKIFNLKQMAKTVMYLQENGLTDLGELERTCDAAVQKFNRISAQTKAANARMKDISELQLQIGAYSKTREIYAQYKQLPPKSPCHNWHHNWKTEKPVLLILTGETGGSGSKYRKFAPCAAGVVMID